MAFQLSDEPPLSPIKTDFATLLPWGIALKSSVGGLITRCAGWASRVKDKSALRELELSFACKTLLPAGQLLCATTLASKVPVRPTTIAPFEFCAWPLFSMPARFAAPEPERAPCMGRDSARVAGRPLSTVSVMEPPGTKPRPCSCNMPPTETAPLLLKESAGELASTKMMPPEAMTTTAASIMMAHFAATPVAAFEAVAIPV